VRILVVGEILKNIIFGDCKNFPHIFYMITIKQFNLKDVDYILHWFSNTKNREFQRTKTIDKDKALRLISSDKNKTVYGIYLDDALIGYAMLKYFYVKVEIGINIDEPFWGHGYGFEAMKLLEEKAKEKKYYKIEVLVNEHNERALKLYKKLGYKDTDLKILEKEL